MKVIVNDIQKDIQYSLDAEYKIYPRNVQFDIINPKDSADLAILCKELSIYDVDVDTKSNSAKHIGRQKINVPFEQAIDVLKNLNIENIKDIYTSIKTYHKPLMKTHDYENDSYFEFCTRFPWNDNTHSDAFIWIRIEMKHLETVLNKFKNKLTYHKI